LCQFNRKKIAAKVKNFYQLPVKDEELLTRILTRHVCTISIDATGRGFGFYAGGIYDGMYDGNVECSTDLHEANHVVTLVGYTMDSYYLRNSWDNTWGNNGYMDIARK
jgi:hypothetical protein